MFTTVNFYLEECKKIICFEIRTKYDVLWLSIIAVYRKNVKCATPTQCEWGMPSDSGRKRWLFSSTRACT